MAKYDYLLKKLIMKVTKTSEKKTINHDGKKYVFVKEGNCPYCEGYGKNAYGGDCETCGGNGRVEFWDRID